MTTELHSQGIRTEEDVVAVRKQARDVAGLLGFDPNEQTRIATAVSEIARNAFHYAGGGKAQFSFDDDSGGALTVRISDAGPGIADVKKILSGHYRSKTGMGMGLLGARRLMDGFELESQPGQGTTVTMSKRLAGKSAHVTPQRLARIAADMTKLAPRNVLDELRTENSELIRVMDELRDRQQDLLRLNTELEDTNRGVVALYAELDEKAERLRRADQMKSRFLSHMSHEFRTPLTSIMALSRLLLDQIDGPLSAGQHKQVTFIRKSAESLLEMVNDLLDLARVEAGKSVVRASGFTVGSVFGALRGVLRPLLVNEAVELIFEDPAGVPPMMTDESKVSQILRNFISNALKFTERGEVRVSARLNAGGDAVIFDVTDTGIGIAPQHLELIFQEFAQIDVPIQTRFQGTGLGLPLSRGLAELLGGRVAVESELGRGSKFSAEIPLTYGGVEAEPARQSGCDLVIIDDEEVSRYLVRQALGSSLSILEADSGEAGLEIVRKNRPRGVLLDLRMAGMTGMEVLKALKDDPVTRDIPVVVLTSKALTAEERDLLTTMTTAVLSKEVLSQADAGQRIRTAVEQRTLKSPASPIRFSQGDKSSR